MDYFFQYFFYYFLTLKKNIFIIFIIDLKKQILIFILFEIILSCSYNLCRLKISKKNRPSIIISEI